MNRRTFLKNAVLAGAGGFGLSLGDIAFASGGAPGRPHTREAYFYRVVDKKTVQCETCPHQCLLVPGRRGKCRAKENIDGKLYSISYGNPCTAHVDPIEKKPLLHFHPGEKAFSIAVAGCNFRCLNCQNWEISQTSPDKTRNINMDPERVVSLAKKYNCRAIAYTYSEAISFYEYMLDTSALAGKNNIKNIWVSNSYINPEPLKRLLGVIDAASLNLKAFTDKIYMDLNGGHLKPVLRNLKMVKDSGVWLELINLMVPTYTDDLDQVKKMCDWIVENLGPDTPITFSRFFPMYKLLHLPATPVDLLVKAAKIASERGINHAYVGNVPALGDNVICSSCKKIVVKRRGFRLLENSLSDKGICPFCGAKVPGRWN